MREIKFRGQQKDTKIWVYGSVIQCAGIWYIYNENESFRMPEDPDFETSFIEVVPETIGQFTGLYDKNRKGIFEGDLLINEDESSKPREVVFEDGAFCIKLGDGRCAGLFQWEINIYGKKTIGNIHENPLLEQ